MIFISDLVLYRLVLELTLRQKFVHLILKRIGSRGQTTKTKTLCFKIMGKKHLKRFNLIIIYDSLVTNICLARLF